MARWCAKGAVLVLAAAGAGLALLAAGSSENRGETRLFVPSDDGLGPDTRTLISGAALAPEPPGPVALEAMFPNSDAASIALWSLTSLSDPDDLAVAVGLLDPDPLPESVAADFAMARNSSQMAPFITPELVVPLLREVMSRGESITEFSIALRDRLMQTRFMEPDTHRRLSIAGAIASQLAAYDPNRIVSQRAEMSTWIAPVAFEFEPGLRIALLERVPEIIGDPQQPDAGYAYPYRQLMDIYAERGNTDDFDRVARRWQETSWPQRDADRQWRTQLIENIRSRISRS